MKQAPFRYWLVILLSQLAGAAVILGFCIWFWHTSWIPVAVYVAFMVLPVLFHAVLGSVGLDPTKTKDALVTSGSDAPSVGERMRIAALPILVAASLGIASLLAFLLPSTRIAVVETTSAQRWQIPAENALWDVVPEVRVAACAAIRQYSADVSSPALLDALGNDENLAPCIMPTLTVGGENMVLAWRQAQWFDTLMHQENTGEHMCETAGYLYHADRIGAATAVTQLFTCAAAASTPQAQECCAQSLSSIRKTGQTDITQLMPTPELMANSPYAQYAPQFLNVAHAVDASPLSSLSADPFKRWSLELACQTLQTAPRDLWLQLEPTFSQALSSNTCRAPKLNDDTLRLWQATCARWTDPQETPETLCLQMSDVTLGDALNRARRFVQTATYRASYTHEPLYTQTKKQAYDRKVAAYKGHPMVEVELAPTTGMEQVLQVWGQELPSSDGASRMQQIEQLREVIRSRQYTPSNQR